MKGFENAQNLFNAYQKSGKFNYLRDSLDILDEIIESQGTDLQRAINFKQIIGRHIQAQLNEILAKSDIDEFGKSLKDDELGDLLYEALSKEDLGNFGRLLRIKIDYFK